MDSSRSSASTSIAADSERTLAARIVAPPVPGQLQPALADEGLRFDSPVPTNGYRWWYVDAFSEDGQIGLTVIAFIGSVFSPYYARARRKGAVDPENHCSINVIFYTPGRKYWAMTERGRGSLDRSRSHFSVGPSTLSRRGDVLTLDVDEWCVPWPSRLRGRIVVRMPQLNPDCYSLDRQGQHRWWPVSPVAAVEVDMQAPAMRWAGRGYVDSNAGTVPLERSFTGWDWMRAEARDGGRIDYDARYADGGSRTLTLFHDADGRITRSAEPMAVAREALPLTPVWRVSRQVRARSNIVNTQTLEDTPFYARSRLHQQEGDYSGLAMHESLDLQRFQQRWVQTLLPFRMPRRSRSPRV